MAVRTVDPDTFAGDEQEALREQVETFMELLEEQQHTPRLTMRIGDEDVRLALPLSVASLMVEALTEVAQGRAVSISTEEEELTTSEAADLLNVSRPHLVKLLEEGEIPFHKVGTHRRVYRDDVLEYKARQREKAEEAMQNLADQAQELGLGY
jgi:excisionase family DNA binding protein